MYYRKTVKHPPVREHAVIEDAPPPDDCFAEQASKWIYILAFVVALLLAVGIHRFFLQLRRLPPSQRGFLNAVAWTTAYNAGGSSAVAQALFIPELGLDAASAPDGQGVAVIAVYPGGQAEAAGLLELDQIITFNGRKVGSPAQFQALVSRALPETEVTVELLRDGILQTTLISVPEGDFQLPLQPAQPAALTL